MIAMVTVKKMSITAIFVAVRLLGRTFRGLALSVSSLIHTKKHDEWLKRPADKQCGPIGQNNGHLCR